jgi:hypothetical protein
MRENERENERERERENERETEEHVWVRQLLEEPAPVQDALARQGRLEVADAGGGELRTRKVCVREEESCR